MHIELIPQVEIGNITRLRIGDILNRGLTNDSFNDFRFAVAYMRLSGVNRIAAAIDSFLNRGGQLAGAVGINDKITSVEALQLLLRYSQNSTIYYTVSDFIYHPKLYLLTGEERATAIIGSANLTRDGLFRNVEIATVIHLDLASREDIDLYTQFDTLLSAFLNG